MNRRTLLSLALLPLAAVPALAQPPLTPLAPTAQDRADIARVEAYLGSLHSLRAHFLQVDASGRTSEGTAWIARPGRMRFQYDPPSPFLLVANYGEVIFQDKQLQQVSRLPLSSTPLGILLSNDIRLSGAVTVTAVTRQPGQLQISLIRTASPGDGSLTLIFADNRLYLYSEDGVVGLAEANPTGYREHGRFTLGQQSGLPTWSHPIIAGGLLIVRDQDTVHAYNVRAR